jgi:hypothetical protein
MKLSRQSMFGVVAFTMIQACAVEGNDSATDSAGSEVNRASSYNPKTHAFAIRCERIPGQGDGKFDRVDVRFEGNTRPGLDGGAANYVFYKNGTQVSDAKCVSGAVSSNLEFSSKDELSKLAESLTTQMKMPGDKQGGVDGPKEIFISYAEDDSLSYSYFKGSCASVPMDSIPSPQSCGFGRSAGGGERACAKDRVALDHLGELCSSLGAEVTRCKGGKSLCSVNVGRELMKKPYAGYKEDGSKVSCNASRNEASREAACKSVHDPYPFAERCTDIGGVPLDDCTAPVSACKSICSKKWAAADLTGNHQ